MDSPPGARRGEHSDGHVRHDGDASEDVNPRQESKRSSVMKHTIGIILLFCTVLMWACCNFLDSSIFADGTYPKPFFATYVTSFFFVLLMIPRIARQVLREVRNGTFGESMRSFFSVRTIRRVFGRDTKPQRRVSGENEVLLGHGSPGARISTMDQNRNRDMSLPGTDDPYKEYLSILDSAQYSLWMSVIWMISNYFNIAGLQWTTVASTTILTATSSVWSLLIGVFLRVERFTWMKALGVLVCFSGVVVISFVDIGSGFTDEPLGHDTVRSHSLTSFTRLAATMPEKTPGEMALGDTIGFIGAVTMGWYTVMVKRSFFKAYPAQLHAGTFLGLIGVWSLVLMWPVFFILHYTGIEPFRLPQNVNVTTTIVLRSASSSGADVFWLFANMLTSPLVASLGLSLNIPLGLVGEMIIQNRYENWVYWVGAAVVVAGFIIVERQEAKEESGAQEDFVRRSQVPVNDDERQEEGAGYDRHQSGNGKATRVNADKIDGDSRQDRRGYGAV